MRFDARLKRLERKRKVMTIGQTVSADVVREVETTATGKEPTEEEIAAILSTRIRSGRPDPAIINEVERMVLNT